MKQVLAFAAFIVVLLVGYLLIKKSDTPQTTYIDSSSTITNEAQKTDAEVIEEGAEKATDITLDQIEKHKNNKRIKDSIRSENRTTFWVYKIGMNKSDPEDFKDIYSKLKGVPNIYLFKESRHSYYLVKNDGYTTEQELTNNKSTLEQALQQAGITDRVLITNLTTYCELHDDVTLHGKEKIASGDKIGCYVCR